MDKNIVVVILVVALLVLSGVQAIQINSLKSDISDGSLNVNAPIGVSAQPVRQQAAPTMVGGC